MAQSRELDDRPDAELTEPGHGLVNVRAKIRVISPVESFQLPSDRRRSDHILTRIEPYGKSS